VELVMIDPVPYKPAIYLERRPPRGTGLRRSLWLAGMREQALAELRKEIDLRPEEPSLHAELGEMLRDLCRFDESISAFGRAIELAPEDAFSWAMRGSAKAGAGRLDAGRDLSRAAALAPDCGWIRCWRGEWLRLRGRHREALDELNAGLRSRPAYVRAFAWRGALLTAMNRTREAEADLGRAIRRDSSYSPARVERAHLRLSAGSYGGAMRDMNAAARLDPKHGWIQGGAGGRTQAGRDADSILRRLAEAAQALGSVWPLAWRGETLLRLRRPFEALSDLSRAVERDGECAKARAWRGEAYRQCGALGLAERELGRAIALDSGDYTAFAWRGLVKEARGDLRGALADLDGALKRNGALALSSRRLAGSRRSPPRAASPASWVVAARARVLLGLDRPAEAERDLDRVLAWEPRSAEAWLLLSRARRRIGRPAAALEALKAARSCVRR
jgi:tetratricopeptide (TPR) repeat protein